MGPSSNFTRSLCLLVALFASWTFAAAPASAQDARDEIAAYAASPEVDATARLERRTPRAAQWDITLEGGLSFFDDPDGILGVTPPAGTPTFNWGENSYDGAFGARLTIGRRASAQSRWQFRGSWLGSFDDDSRQVRRRFGFTPTPGGALTLSPFGDATISNETEIWSVELNYWRRIQCNDCAQLDVGIGGRVVAIDDEASATNWTGLAPNSNLVAEVDNRFLGIQLMGQWTRRASGRLQVSATGKLLLGWINRDMTESDTSIVTGGATTNGAREETDIGWGFELEIAAVFRVMPRVGITASYTLLYLSDITRAEQAIDLSQAATGSVQMRDATDSALIHSLFLGVRIDL